MPHAHQVTIEADVPEPRAILGRLVALADGTTFSTDASTNIYIDPVTRTSFLQPLPLTSAWLTTFTGSYARLVKADYTGLTSASWYDLDRRAAGDTYVQSAGSTSEVATTSTTWGVNQPMFLSLHVAGFQDLTNQTFLECGWGTPGAAGSVWLRFRADGSVTVYKATLPVGRYDWRGSGALALAGGNATGQTTKSRTIDILLLPCRWRSLLCIVGGGGFEHVDETLAEWTNGASGPTITPAAKFFWRVPSDAGTACVQCAPARFATTGSLISPLISFRYAPPTASSFIHNVFGDPVGTAATGLTYTGSLVNSSGVPITWDGSISAAYLNLNITGDGTNTYGIYSHDAVLVPTAGSTANDPVDLSTLVDIDFAARRNRPCELTVVSKRRASDLTAAGLDQAQITTDRPVRVKIGTIDIFRGTLSEPAIEIREADNGASTDASHIVWRGLDRLAELNYNTYQDALPFDNRTLRNAISTLFEDCGIPTGDLSLDDDGFRLPFSPTCAAGEWIHVQQFGETRGQWLESLHGDYARTWDYYWAPTLTGYKFLWRDPSGLSTTPAMELFEGSNLARTYGIAGGLADYRTIKDVDVERIAPEANQIIVRGYDPRRRAPVRSIWNNAASQDPTTAPASRPSDWRGRVHSITFQSPRVTSQTVADRIRDLLSARVGVVRRVVRWRSDLLIRETDARPLWLGDVVRIFRAVSGASTGTARGDARITEMSGRLLMNRDGERPIWDCAYVAEMLDT
jgi:hypothetical protein